MGRGLGFGGSMQIGDLVKPSWTMLHFNQIGIIIGVEDRVFMQGPSIQKQCLVSWADGTQEWYHINNLEVYYGNR